MWYLLLKDYVTFIAMFAASMSRWWYCNGNKYILEIGITAWLETEKFKVSKGAKIRNRYNQVPHLTQDNRYNQVPQLTLHNKANDT